MPVKILGIIKEVRTFTSTSADKTGTVKIEFNLSGHEKMIGELTILHQLEKQGVVAVIMTEEKFDRFSKKEKK